MKQEQVIIKGLWIPDPVLKDDKLTMVEKVVYSMLLSLSNNEDNECFASNSYLSKTMKITSRRIQQILSSLKNKGYISTRNIFHGDTKKISHRVVKIISSPLRKGLHVDNTNYKTDYIIQDRAVREIFNEFVKYRKEIGKPLVKSSAIASAQKLKELSGGNSNLAELIVKQTIENGWSGLFPLKDKPQGKLTEAGRILELSNLSVYKNKIKF